MTTTRGDLTSPGPLQKAVFENQEEMMEAHAAAAETVLANFERNS